MEKIKIKNLVMQDASDEIDKILNDVKNEKPFYDEIKKLDLSNREIRENIAFIISAFDDYKYCKNCPGYDKCSKDLVHQNVILKKNGKVLERLISPCHLFSEIYDREKLYIVSDYPSSWDNVDASEINKTANVKKVFAYAPKFINKSSSNWLYIKGASGTGKSFIAAMLLRLLTTNGYKDVAFINTPLRIQKLMDLTYNNKELFDKTFDQYKRAEVLVLDEFGNEYKSDFIRDTIMIPLLSARVKNNLLTIFTSDFSLDEILELYANSKAGRIRSKQLINIIKTKIDSEIDLGDLSVYDK